MSGDSPNDEDSATRTSIGAATLLRKDRLLAERYRIISPIGAGGMGLVYRAHDERLDLDIAIKVLRPERSPDAAMLERFEREIVLAREVSHPNVVRIHDIGQDGNLHFITMDLVEGRSLRELMESEGPLDAATSANIIADIASGLDAAHDKGVVHRDLKPANILLDKDDKAFITDFGVARSLYADNLTRTGIIVGSPDYLSPEQARGDEIDGRADIYALGLILYEMLSGELPFRGGTIEELLAQRTIGEPRDLATAARVPSWLRRVIYRCLQKDPDDRFATAAELAEALRSHSGPRMRLRRTGKRRIAIAAVALAVVAMAYLGYRFLPGNADGQSLRLVVLPMSNDTGRPELLWLATGLNDMLATQLSETGDIEFIETSRITEIISDLRLDPTNLDKRSTGQLAELLSADHILSGAIRSGGEGLRVDANLRRGDGGKSQTIVAQTGQKTPHELVSRLAEQLRSTLAVPPVIGEQVILSSSTEALEAYVRGLDAIRKGSDAAAIPMLEAATRADPGFAIAWFHLADAYASTGYLDKAKEAIRKAEAQISDVDTRTGLQVAALRAKLDGDFTKSQTILARLIERFPSDVPTRMALAEAYGGEGQFDQANKILKTVITNDPNHPEAWFLLGVYAISVGDYRRAIDEYLVRNLVIQNRLENDRGKASSFNAMGIANSDLGKLAAARQNYEQAAELWNKIGDRQGVAKVLNNLAQLEIKTGNFASARTNLEQAIEAGVELGDNSKLSAYTNTMGMVEEEVGNYAAALSQYRAALKIREELGDRRALAQSYDNVGFAYYLLGELDNADIYCKRALDESRALENRFAQMKTLQNLGLINMAKGKWDPALKAFQEALVISREQNVPVAEAVSIASMGQIAAMQGRYTVALDQLDQASKTLEPVGDTRGLIEFGLRRADIFAALELDNQLKSQLKKVGKWLQDSPNLEQQADYLALSALADQPADQAADLLQQAIAAAEGSRSIAAILRVRLARARQAFLTGDHLTALEEARSIAEKAGNAGYAALQLRSLLLLTQTTRLLESDAAAVKPANNMLELLERHKPFAEAYQIHALASDILSATGKEEKAVLQQTLALNEVGRLREGLPKDAVDSFNARISVRKLREEALVDGQ